MPLFEHLARVMAPSDTLKLHCEACGRKAQWSRAQAFAAFGPTATPYDVRKLMRCSACGSRRVEVSL